MVLPTKSKVFAILSLVIAVILISINVISCIGGVDSSNASRSSKSKPTSLQENKNVIDTLPFDFHQPMIDQVQFAN